MDLLLQIERDHHELLLACERLVKAPRSLRAWRERLEAHACTERAVLDERLMAEASFRDWGHEAGEEHHVGDVLVRELALYPVTSEVWPAKVRVLTRWLESHFTREETELLPRLRAHLSRDEWVTWGEEYRARRAVLLSARRSHLELGA